MYQYEICGEDYVKTKVTKIGKSIAVSVPKEWYNSDVIVISAGDIKSFKKIYDDEMQSRGR